MSVMPVLILTVPPGQLDRARPLGLPLAHMAYRLGRGGQLLRSDLPLRLRGGLMVLSDAGYDGSGDPGGLCRQVVGECAARGFDGILCDFEQPPVPALAKLAGLLSRAAARRGWRCLVPLTFAGAAPGAGLLVSSALSGGSLDLRLRELGEQYGPRRLALAVERTAEDFFLPAPTGCGVPLSREELARRLEERRPAVFFSPDLCAHYFTYMSRENGAHFVLFDTADSIREKLRLARAAGVETAVLAYPEVDDLLPGILQSGRNEEWKKKRQGRRESGPDGAR